MSKLSNFILKQKKVILILAMALAHIILCISFLIIKVKLLSIYNLFSAAFYLLMLVYTKRLGDFQFLFGVAFEIPIYSFLSTIFLGNNAGTILFPFAMLCGVFLYTVNGSYSIKKYSMLAIPSIITIILITVWPFSQILDPETFKGFIFAHKFFSSILAIICLLYLNISTHQELVISEKKNEKYIEQLRFMSNNDPLTKVLNRRSTQKKMESISVYSLVMFDIDDFKKFNDTYGHDAGDSILVELTKRISEVLPEDALFSRWGGEEFIIVYPNHSDQAILSITNLCSTVSTDLFKLEHAPSVKITITGGVAFSQPGLSFEKVISSADKLLYQGKSQGKNQIVFPQSY